MIDIQLVGHYTHDIIISRGIKHEKQGGPPSYMTPFFDALNLDFHVVSKIGKNAPYFFAFHNKVALGAAPTTSFVLDYSDDERSLKCSAVCDSINQEDIGNTAKVTLACGVANEIAPGALEEMRKKSWVLLGDIQGFCRRVDPLGNVFLVDPLKTWFKDYAKLFDFIKVSLSEAKIVDVDDLRTKTNVIITEGFHGCRILMKNGRDISVFGFPVEETDPTGAGDAFLAGFAYGLLKNKDVEECARLGNFFGALTVKQMGVPVITKNDLKQIL